MAQITQSQHLDSPYQTTCWHAVRLTNADFAAESLQFLSYYLRISHPTLDVQVCSITSSFEYVETNFVKRAMFAFSSACTYRAARLDTNSFVLYRPFTVTPIKYVLGEPCLSTYLLYVLKANSLPELTIVISIIISIHQKLLLHCDP